MDSDEQEVMKLSKFNSGGLMNIRLHNLWVEVNKSSISGKYSKWNLYLDRVWSELSGDASKDDKEKLFKITLELPISLSIIKKGFGVDTKEDIEKKSLQYVVLQRKEEFLRKLMNKQGKGTAYDEEDDWE